MTSPSPASSVPLEPLRADPPPAREEISVLALSPDDLAPFGGRPDAWAFAPLHWPADACFIALPPTAAIVETADPQEADPLLAGRPVLLLDRAALVRLNVWRSRARLPIVPTARFRSLRALVSAVGEPDMPSLLALGQEGSARLDLAETAGMPAAQAGVVWTTNLLCLLLGIEEQRRLMGVA
jgi:hypothetical protein